LHFWSCSYFSALADLFGGLFHWRQNSLAIEGDLPGLKKDKNNLLFHSILNELVGTAYPVAEVWLIDVKKLTI
jgi:hypothetical protein